MDRNSAKALSAPIVIFHIGGGDEDIGPSEALLNLKDVDIELYIFEIIDEADYTEVDRFKSYPNVSAKIIPFGIGEFEGEEVSLQINNHQLSSSLLPPSNVTLTNNPAYPGILDWEENTKLNKEIKAKLSSIDSLVSKGVVPKPDFLSLDIQGYELKALIGAKSALQETVLGIVLESEFTEIYQGQGLFAEQSKYLRENGFRLVELFNPQSWFIGPVLGDGFLTVVESLYFKHVIKVDFHVGDMAVGFTDIREMSEDKIMKLAVISFAFSRFSYFYTLIKYIEDNNKRRFDSYAQDKKLGKFIAFYQKMKSRNAKQDLTHSVLSKNFNKIFKSDLSLLTYNAYQYPDLRKIFFLSFRNYIYQEIPFLLWVRKRFIRGKST
jgi:FkbM family methyltransferase